MDNINNKDLLGIVKDPKRYLEAFCKIKTKEGGLAPFILNEAQKDFFNTLRDSKRVIINKARQMGFCFDKDTKVLSTNLEWITLDEIKVGQEIIACDENVVNKRSRRLKTAIVEGKSEIYSEAIRVTMDNGEELIMTPGHRMLCRERTGVVQEWREAKDLIIGDEIRSITKTWDKGDFDDGKFGGLIDGEGSLSKLGHSGTTLRISQVDGKVWDFLLRYVNNKGIDHRIEVDRRKPGLSSKLGSKEVNKLVIGRMSDVIKVLGQTRPVRLLGRNFWEGKVLPSFCSQKVVAIEHLPKRRMIDLQTSAKTYIANGFVSNNSTSATGYIYHKAITTPGITCALVGYNSDLTTELLDKIKTFLRTTPAEVRPTVEYNSKYEITFPKLDSKILVLPSTENVGRGYTLHACLLTEVAFWEKDEEKMVAIENSVPASGQIIVESTPNGISNWYARNWLSEESAYTKKAYGWWWHYTEDEISLIKARMNNPMKFAQEYSLELLASGRLVFDQDVIKKQSKNIVNVGDKYKDKKGEVQTVTEWNGLRMYKEPEANGVYVIGADTSEGVVGGDYSTCSILDRETGEEVGFYRGLMAPDKFGKKLDEWGRKFNNALMVVEINNHGLTVLTILKQLMYPTLYFRPSQLETMGTSYSDRLGWKTTKLTRPLLIDDLGQALREDSITIHSKEIVNEMTTFIYDKQNNATAQSGSHDDGIFSLGIAFQGFKILWKGELKQIDYNHHLPTSYNY